MPRLQIRKNISKELSMQIKSGMEGNTNMEQMNYYM